jgi:hypothetical protein
MKKLSVILLLLCSISVSSCLKEISQEQGTSGGDSGVVIGTDCRISKISYADSATNIGFGALSAVFNAQNNPADITLFDSLSQSIDYNTLPQYFSDTVYTDVDEYFIQDPRANQRIISLHASIDPSVPNSPEYDIKYIYDAGGKLIKKEYFFTSIPNTPFQSVTYSYTGGNLTGMTSTDLFSNEVVEDAQVTYFTNITPKNFMYIFPDEEYYANLTQFYNFGAKPVNAVKTMKVRYYANNVPVDSAVSVFSNYILSRDNYVLKATIAGDDQLSIPTVEGKMSFSYKCK